MKQLVPTGLDEYLADHKDGDTVTGRITEIADGTARVELGEGVFATCRIPAEGTKKAKEEKGPEPAASKPDLSSLGSMLQARWKSGPPASEAAPDSLRAGQVREFRIAKLDAEKKKIDLELS